MPDPLISVIIVCRNPGTRLQTALASVWAQRNVDVELVVIDGASTDGSSEWLETQRHRIAALLSAADAGIYDAMNKGIAFARGEWLLFLGADDRLAHQDVLATVAASLAQTTAAVGVGDAAFDDGRRYIFSGTSGAIRRNFVHHQGAFYRRTLFTQRGNFDLSLRLQADYDLNLRLLLAGEKFIPLSLHVSVCGSGGLSDSGRWQNYREEITVRHRHFPRWQSGLWDAFAFVRYLRKNLIRRFART